MIAFISLIISVIVFCIFIGMFLRLGRIEGILLKMALHQGAIDKKEAEEEKYYIFGKENRTTPGQEHFKGCTCGKCQDLRKSLVKRDLSGREY